MVLFRTFQPIEEDEPVDVEALIAGVDPALRVRASFTEHARAVAAARGLDVSGIPSIREPTIPMRESLRLSLALATLLWPELPMRRRLRMLGRVMYASLFEHTVARALFRFTLLSPASMLRMTPAALRFANAPGVVAVTESAPGKYVLSFRAYHSFRDILVGCIDAMLAATGHVGDVRLRAASETDFELEVAWQLEERVPPGRYGLAGEILIKS